MHVSCPSEEPIKNKLLRQLLYDSQVTFNMHMCVSAYAYVYIEVLAQVYVFTLLKKPDVCLLGQPRLYSLTDKVVNKARDFTIAVRNPVDLL